jgi:hypothetical protein
VDRVRVVDGLKDDVPAGAGLAAGMFEHEQA